MKHFETMKKRMTALPMFFLFLLSFSAVGRAEVRVVASPTWSESSAAPTSRWTA